MTQNNRSTIRWLQDKLAESDTARRRVEANLALAMDLLADRGAELDLERQARQSAEAKLERALQEVPPHFAEDLRRRHLDAWRGTSR